MAFSGSIRGLAFAGIKGLDLFSEGLLSVGLEKRLPTGPSAGFVVLCS